MRNISFFFLIGIFIVSLAACKSPTQVLYQESGTNFSDYKTFGFYEMHIDNETALEPQKKNLELLMKDIEKQMTRRGYKKQKDNPDLRINIGIMVEYLETTRETTLRDAPAYIGQRNYHWESEEIVVSVDEKGTVVLDVVDLKKDKLVWQASTSKMIVKNQDKMAKRIDDGVEKLFESFPVQ